MRDLNLVLNQKSRNSFVVKILLLPKLAPPTTDVGRHVDLTTLETFGTIDEITTRDRACNSIWRFEKQFHQRYVAVIVEVGNSFRIVMEDPLRQALH